MVNSDRPAEDTPVVGTKRRPLFRLLLLILPLLLAAGVILSWRAIDQQWRGPLYAIMTAKGRVFVIDPESGYRMELERPPRLTWGQWPRGDDPYPDVPLETVDRVDWTPTSASHVSSLSHIRNVTVLSLDGSKVSDETLVYLRDLDGLTSLFLGRARVTGSGFDSLPQLPALRRLSLEFTAISDEGLTHVAELRHIEALDLSHTAITDSGLARLKTMTALRELSLAGTRIDGSGLGHLRELPNLAGLRLNYTQVNDENLRLLEGMDRLWHLDLCNTPVTPEGAEKLQSHLPRCNILSGRTEDPR